MHFFHDLYFKLAIAYDKIDLTDTNEFSDSSSEDFEDIDNPSLTDTADILITSLVEWVASLNIPSTAVTALPNILHKHHSNLPQDLCTLIKTPHAHDICELWYHGTTAGIKEI